MGSRLTVGPNEAVVVSGAFCGSDEKTYMVGGWAWAWWLITDIQRITLEIMTLQPKCEDVETAEGVAITVTGVAQEAECKKEMMDVKFLADTKMADSKRELELQKAAFNQEVNTKKAEAQLAYELQAAKEQQKIRLEEIEIEVVQRKKQITIEEKEIVRTEKELIAMVQRPAEAEAYKMQQLAEGQKMKKVLTAQAEAEKIRRIGEAEAGSIDAIGKAEAEKMRLKAEAYQQYGEAAKTALVLEALPKIAAKVAAPLARTNEIVILSGEGNHVTGEVNRLLAELPVSVNAVTGIDLSKIPLLQKMTYAQA